MSGGQFSITLTLIIDIYIEKGHSPEVAYRSYITSEAQDEMISNRQRAIRNNIVDSGQADRIGPASTYVNESGRHAKADRQELQRITARREMDVTGKYLVDQHRRHNGGF